MEPKKPTEGTLAGPTNLGNPAGPTNPAVGNPAGRRSCIARSVDNRHLERRATTKPTAPAQPAKGPARAHRTEAARAVLALHQEPTEPNQAPPDPHQAPPAPHRAPTEPNAAPTDPGRGLAARPQGPPVPNGTEAAPGERRTAPEAARSQSLPPPKRTSAAHRQIQFAASRELEAPNLAPSRPTESRRHSERSRSPRGPGPRPGRFALRGRKAARLRRGLRAQNSPGQTSGVKTLARRRP